MAVGGENRLDWKPRKPRRWLAGCDGRLSTGRDGRAGRQFRDERPFLSRPMASTAAAGTSDSTLRLSSTTLSCSDNGSFLTRHPSIHQHAVGKQTIYEKIKKTNVKLSRPQQVSATEWKV